MHEPELVVSDSARYVQLVDYLRTSIADGRLVAGARLPTEHELAEQHQISRGTVRQAMGVLVNEGLIERVQGRGSFVRLSPAPLQATERRIGLILSHSGAQLELDILRGVEQVVKERGYQLTFAYTNDRVEQLKDDVARLRADRALGLLICLDNDVTRNQTVAQLQRDGVPVVLVDRYFSDLDTDYIAANNLEGGFRATEHLLVLGHVRIGFVYTSVGTLQTTSVRDRWLGYKQALENYGVPFDEALTFCCPYPQLPQAEPPSELVAYLQRPDRPSAIFAVHDQLALHLMQAARQIGLQIPNDIALVGFDNLSYANHLTPPLTTMAQPRMELGIRAGHLLLDRIEGQRGATQHVELPVRLIVRESCGARARVRDRLCGTQSCVAPNHS